MSDSDKNQLPLDYKDTRNKRTVDDFMLFGYLAYIHSTGIRMSQIFNGRVPPRRTVGHTSSTSLVKEIKSPLDVSTSSAQPRPWKGRIAI